MKSDGLRPVIALPLLSLMMRSSTTSCVLVVELDGPFAAAGAGGCCLAARAAGRKGPEPRREMWR